ncbi:hypothetical protein, partial [Rhizobium metallidurans]|uniref:hypothetical protein n=1 Tax=Rhizobium metallidurans TaxID=1265931 RepID=UPI001AED7857
HPKASFKTADPARNSEQNKPRQKMTGFVSSLGPSRKARPFCMILARDFLRTVPPGRAPFDSRAVQTFEQH